MKLTIETTNVKEALEILSSIEAKEAPQEQAAVPAPAHTAPKAEAKVEAAAPANHKDEVANKRSEAAATKKAKADAEAKAHKAEEKTKAKEEEADPLAGLEDEAAAEEEEVDLEMVQNALRAAMKANKDNKVPIRQYFSDHGIVGGVDAIPEELFVDCYEFAKGLM